MKTNTEAKYKYRAIQILNYLKTKDEISRADLIKHFSKGEGKEIKRTEKAISFLYNNPRIITRKKVNRIFIKLKDE
jgi:hypothetical protein